MYNNEIGQRIYLLRKEKGYTQEQISMFLNVTPQAVSKWETGNALPDTALLPILAKVLEVSIDILLTGGSIEKTSPYDGEYTKNEYYWGLNHSLLAEQIVEIMKNEMQQEKRLLDIGSGEGRDSIYFAKCGFQVDALEISTPGIEKIKLYSQSAGYKVNVIHTNMINYQFTYPYNVIYSMGSLQFLPLEQRKNHFENYKRYTKTGGINAHLVFVEKPFIKIAPDWAKNEFFYVSGDLAKYYHDWEIIKCEEVVINCDSSGELHQHMVNYIVARKINI